MSKVKAILKRFALLREYTVLTNIDVQVKNEKHHFDNLMIGEFGILNVCCYNKKGELYGNESDEKFALVDFDKNKQDEENLIHRTEKDISVLREILADNKIYNVKIEGAIVAENKYCDLMISSEKFPALSYKEFKKHMNCGKYDLDNKAEKERIVNAILSCK